MAVSFEGIGQLCLTLKTLGTVQPGDPCFITDNATVAACGEEESFFGIVDRVDEGLASVIVRGIVTIPYSGTAPNLGRDNLAPDGNGGLAQYSDASELTVISVDKVNQTVTILL